MRKVRGVAFDGGVCAGKTTVRAAVERSLGWKSIPEFMDVVSDNEKRAAFDFSGADTIDLFLVAEDRRSNFVEPASCHCLDRSFLTLAAFRYAAARISLISRQELIVASEKMMRASYLLPDGYVFLDVSHETRETRSAERDTGSVMPFPLLDRPFNDHFAEYFAKLSSSGYVEFISNEGRDFDFAAIIDKVRAIVNDPREPGWETTFFDFAVGTMVAE